jgi:hypothetical protein
VEIKPAGAGTRLIFTEQAVFLDDFDDAGGRERGTRAHLERLDVALRRASPGGTSSMARTANRHCPSCSTAEAN